LGPKAHHHAKAHHYAYAKLTQLNLGASRGRRQMSSQTANIANLPVTRKTPDSFGQEWARFFTMSRFNIDSRRLFLRTDAPRMRRIERRDK
jgi:hypothetical protein